MGSHVWVNLKCRTSLPASFLYLEEAVLMNIVKNAFWSSINEGEVSMNAVKTTLWVVLIFFLGKFFKPVLIFCGLTFDYF